MQKPTFVRGRSACALAAIVLLAALAPTAQGLFLQVSEPGNGTFFVIDNSALDTNIVTGQIDVNVTTFNLFFSADAEFQSLSATSNAIALGGTNTPAVLQVSGTIDALVDGSGKPLFAPITVEAIDTPYSFPTTPTVISESASDTFTFPGVGVNRTFQSFYDQTRSGSTAGPAAPLESFSPPAGVGPFSTSGNDSAGLGTQPGAPFALVNKSVFSLTGSTDFASLVTDQFTGSTVVGVPEPATLGLILSAAMVLLGARKRRA